MMQSDALPVFFRRFTAQAQRYHWTDIGKDEDGIDDQLHLRINLSSVLHPLAAGDADAPVPWKKAIRPFCSFSLVKNLSHF